MTREEAIKEIEKVFEPAFANYIITALIEGATVSDKEPTTKDNLGVEAPILHLEPDNCGNYVVQSIPVKLNITEIKKHQSDFSDLEQEPITKNALGVDCILRQQAIDAFPDLLPNMGYNKKAITEILQELPSVTPQEPRKGHWVTRPHVFGVAYCSECDFELNIDNTNFCPNCGAKMDKE